MDCAHKPLTEMLPDRQAGQRELQGLDSKWWSFVVSYLSSVYCSAHKPRRKLPVLKARSIRISLYPP